MFSSKELQGGGLFWCITYNQSDIPDICNVIYWIYQCAAYILPFFLSIYQCMLSAPHFIQLYTVIKNYYGQMDQNLNIFLCIKQFCS